MRKRAVCQERASDPPNLQPPTVRVRWDRDPRVVEISADGEIYPYVVHELSVVQLGQRRVCVTRVQAEMGNEPRRSRSVDSATMHFTHMPGAQAIIIRARIGNNAQKRKPYKEI